MTRRPSGCMIWGTASMLGALCGWAIAAACGAWQIGAIAGLLVLAGVIVTNTER